MAYQKAKLMAGGTCESELPTSQISFLTTIFALKGLMVFNGSSERDSLI